MTRSPLYSRRSMLGLAAGTGVALATGSSAVFAQGATPDGGVDGTHPLHLINSFMTRDWRGNFDNLDNGAILVDVDGRCLHYWSEDQATYLIFPTSVPVSEDLTRRGRTSIIRKIVDPEWRPTPNMIRRNPDWPRYVGPGPENPLGTHALYLSWEYYRIHGTNDTRKIGRQASNGCIGLYNDDVAVLFDLAKVGTQVLLI